MRRKNQKENILVEPGAYPEKHELRTAEVLVSKYDRVLFLKPVDLYNIKSADILMNGLKWEIKSPKTRSLSGVEQILKRATKKSQNIVLDSQRIKCLRDIELERYLHNKAAQQKTIKKLIFVNRKREIVDIK